MRASATSRIASLAASLFPQSKADAGNADDISPFALLLNEVQAKPAVQQKDPQNKNGSGTSPNSSEAASQASGSDPATQAAAQAAIKPVKPDNGQDKAEDKSDGTDGEKNDGSSSVASSGMPPQQASVQTQPPAGPQISIIMATLADGGTVPVQADSKPSAPSANDLGAGRQAVTGAGRAGTNAPTSQPASQAGKAETVNSPAGQTVGLGAQTPAPNQNGPQPGPVPAALIPPSTQPQTAVTAPNIVQPNTAQPDAAQPASAQSQQPQASATANAVQPTAAPQGPVQLGVQLAVQPAAEQDISPAIPQTQPSAAANTVRPNVAQQAPIQPAVQPAIPQAQTPAAPVQQAVTQDLTPAAPPQDGNLQTQAPPKSVSAGSSGDKHDAKSTGSAAPAGSVQSSTVQPDPPQISTAAIPVTVAAVADDDTADDQPGIEAAGAAAVSASGVAKTQAGQNGQGAQAAKNIQAAPAAPEDEPSSQAAASQTASQPDAPQQDALPFLRPWQVKTQNGDGTGDPKTDASQTTIASPDQVKQAPQPAPQAVAAGTVPLARPADTSGGTMPLIGGTAPQAPSTQSATSPVLAQTVQVSTPSPNLPALAVEIAARSQSGIKQFDIRLDPPELGRVEIRLSIDTAGKASAHLSADQPQTLDLLQKDAPVLTRALRDAGLNVSQNGLNFSLRQQQGDAGAGTNQRSGGNPRSFTLAATASIDAASAGGAWRAPANGRLDIRV